MFHWKKKNEQKHVEEKHDYNLTFDNVAIPEVHTHKTKRPKMKVTTLP